MSMRLHFLGAPGAFEDGEWLEPSSRLLLLLAAYLASHDNWRDRSELGRLFWPDYNDQKARKNLNQLFYRCKHTPWAAGIERHFRRVRWRAQSDLQLFRRAFDGGHWHDALSHYRGDFLAGIEAYGNEEVATWLAQERSDLKRRWYDAVHYEAERLESNHAAEAAIDLLLQAHRQDPLDERTLKAYMRSTARSGRRRDALEAFGAFRQQLERDLDTTPSADACDLAEAVRAGQLDPPPSALVVTTPADPVDRSVTDATTPTAPTLRGPHFPSDVTPFVGRSSERSDLAAWLRDPARQLVSILGPGGIGKSRMVVCVAHENAACFADGSFFVELAPLTSARDIPATLVEVMGLEPPQRLDPVDYLCRQLADQTTLLVLDNFEHLLGGADIVARLLDAAPNLTIMITSRAPLGLRREWRYDLQGLAFPEQGADPSPETYDAVRLFVQSARQRSPHFRTHSRNREAVAQICRMLCGSPLAIELVTPWVDMLHPEEIIRELQNNFDLLESTATDRPGRQRSLRAVFEYSWSMLEKDHQDVLARLSVFRSGFTREAAADVAGATLRTLRSLIDKSLVTPDGDGRFGVLELIRYYAAEKLARDDHAERETRERHAHHHFALVWRRDPASGAYLTHVGAGVEALADATEHRLDNIRAALRWLYDRRDVERGVRLLDTLGTVLIFKHGNYREVSRWAKDFLALPQLAAPSELRGRVLDLQGWAHFELGRFKDVEQSNTQLLQICQQFRLEDKIARVTTELGVIYGVQEQFERAADLLHQGVTLFRQLNDPRSLAWALASLARNSFYQGDYDAAQRYSDQALALHDAHPGTLPPRSLITVEIARAQGRLGDALQHCHLCLHRELNVYKVRTKRKLEQALIVAFSLFVEIGEASAAAKLWGAAERWRQSVGAVRYPDAQRGNNQSLTKLKATTPEDTFEQSLAAGRAMSLEQAAQFALDLCLSKLSS